ncbi:hypothetical protein SIM22_05435 [Bacillus cereus group sp. BfR-BA-01363]|uniref:hypothetical protein n=1 Tax=Bacillus cereus group sp. BfR-BA-01363 TaxID=3094882 RepID=UPI0029C18AA0|nr:hypothetical protein [Bacillus cereus group sp. BfR-BA-01363]MDX5853576.1 hypothetical protein [Bacillus cereus group sp. BfR-BA-01363]
MKRIMLGILGAFLCSLGFIIGYIIIYEFPSGRSEWLSLGMKSVVFAILLFVYDYIKMVMKRKRTIIN